jgi:hypothetical protein
VPWNLKQRLYQDFNPVTVISGHNRSALSNLILLVSDPSCFLPNFRLPFTPKGDPTPVPSVLRGVLEYLHILLTAPSTGEVHESCFSKVFFKEQCRPTLY